MDGDEDPLFRGGRFGMSSRRDLGYSDMAETVDAGLAFCAVSLVSKKAITSVIGLVWIPSVLKAFHSGYLYHKSH